MRNLVGNSTFTVVRNDKTKVTMVENKKDRTIFPIDDMVWKDFVQAVVVANRHVLKEIDGVDAQ